MLLLDFLNKNKRENKHFKYDQLPSKILETRLFAQVWYWIHRKKLKKKKILKFALCHHLKRPHLKDLKKSLKWTLKNGIAKSLQSFRTLCDPIDGSPPGSRPWDSPGKNTGVGCHFLPQCMNVKSESEVAQSCPTLSDPMDCSLPGSSIHGIF